MKTPSSKTLFVASRVKPTHLVALEPADSAVAVGVSVSSQQRRASVQEDFLPVLDPHPGLADAASRLLRAASLAFSDWFMAMRSCIRREKARQQSFREHNGLPKRHAVPYERQPLTASEAATVAQSEAIVRALFGSTPAEYAKVKFSDAVNTGDLRAFKIRLLMFKARDSLLGSVLYADFSSGLERSVSEAEKRAGCVPDPTPRRLSLAEQARKKARESSSANDRNNEAERTADDLPLFKETHKNNDRNLRSSKTARNSNISKNAKFNILNKGKNAISIKNQDNTPVSNNIECNVTHDITRNVTNSNSYEIDTVSKPETTPLRKARDYSSVEEILEDISAGIIAPYRSTSEILDDVSAGRITKVEALLFTLALDRYDPLLDDELFLDEEYDDEEELSETSKGDEEEDQIEADGYSGRWSDWVANDD